MFLLQVNFVLDIPHVFAKSVVKLSGGFANIQHVTFVAGDTADDASFTTIVLLILLHLITGSARNVVF